MLLSSSFHDHYVEFSDEPEIYSVRLVYDRYAGDLELVIRHNIGPAMDEVGETLDDTPTDKLHHLMRGIRGVGYCKADNVVILYGMMGPVWVVEGSAWCLCIYHALEKACQCYRRAHKDSAYFESQYVATGLMTNDIS